MTITPEDILELHSIDPDERGARLWRSYAWKIADGMGAAAAVAAVCAEEHLPRAAVYGMMKRTLAPVFEMPEELWRMAGLIPQTTTGGLAREIARSMNVGNTIQKEGEA